MHTELRRDTHNWNLQAVTSQFHTQLTASSTSLGNHQGYERCLNLTAVEPDNPPTHEELTNGKEECQWIFSHLLKGLLGQQDSLCPLDSRCSPSRPAFWKSEASPLAQKARDLCSQMCARSSHRCTIYQHHETEESITPFFQAEFWEAPPLYHYGYKTTERKQPRHVIKSIFQRNRSGKGSPLLDRQWISACLHSRIIWEAFEN